MLAALVAVLLLFLLNLGRIRQTLISTNFNDIVRTQRGAEPPKAAPTAPAAPAPRVDGGPQAAPLAPPQGQGQDTGANPNPPSVPAPQPAPGKVQPGGAAAGTAAGGSAAHDAQNPTTTAQPGAAQGATQGAAQTASQQGNPKGGAAVARTRAVSLYFVRIDDDGVIVRKEVKRNLALSDAPLTDTLAALLRGPTEDELREKLISLVPEGTKLLGVEVRGSTAFVNFNDAFMYNHYGIEGYAGQLKQIVYTATAFPTVQDVQILIEGERHDYLGGEGVYIGKPLSRNSF